MSKPKKNKTSSQSIILTDLMLHTNDHSRPKPLGRQVQKSLKSGSPGRAYSPQFKMDKNGRFTFTIPLGEEMVDKNGNPIKILIPKEGIPIMLGPDMIAKLQSLYKNKNAT